MRSRADIRNTETIKLVDLIHYNTHFLDLKQSNILRTFGISPTFCVHLELVLVTFLSYILDFSFETFASCLSCTICMSIEFACERCIFIIIFIRYLLILFQDQNAPRIVKVYCSIRNTKYFDRQSFNGQLAPWT